MRIIIATFCVLPTLVVSDNNCFSFMTNGTVPAAFNYYRFYDFRNLTDGYPSATGSRVGFPHSLLVNDGSWTSDWTVREQNKGAASRKTIGIDYSKANIYVEAAGNATGSALVLKTAKGFTGVQSAAELDFTAANITYGSIRTMARVSGNSGAVAGLFTYHNDSNEIDIELLTRDPSSRAHFSTQPTTTLVGNSVPGSTYNNSIPDYESWNTYRMDWLKDQVIWYINGKETQKSRTNVPRVESMVILNMWSNAGPWSGSMNEGDSASMQVQWIEMTFNTSQKIDLPTASTPHMNCVIDKDLGTPVPSAGRRIISEGNWAVYLVGGALWFLR